MQCIHPSQRCISSRHMTDNIFEIETTALTHVACSPQESGILVTIFCCCLLQRQSLLDLLPARDYRVVRMCLPLPATTPRTCNFSNWVTVSSGPGCKTELSCECFSFCNGFRSYLQMDPNIDPRNLDILDFLQPAQCACADDLAVAALSFRDLMTALAASFRSVDHLADLNSNHRKSCWVQYGTEGRESLWHWISENLRRVP